MKILALPNKTGKSKEIYTLSPSEKAKKVKDVFQKFDTLSAEIDISYSEKELDKLRGRI